MSVHHNLQRALTCIEGDCVATAVRITCPLKQLGIYLAHSQSTPHFDSGRLTLKCYRKTVYNRGKKYTRRRGVKVREGKGGRGSEFRTHRLTVREGKGATTYYNG